MLNLERINAYFLVFWFFFGVGGGSGRWDSAVLLSIRDNNTDTRGEQQRNKRSTLVDPIIFIRSSDDLRSAAN